MVKTKFQTRICALFLTTAMLLGTGANAAPPDPSPRAVTGDVYVATTGSDTNNGTQASPVKTLGKARDIARTKNGGGATPVTVVVAAGKYYVSEAIALSAQDSNVTYKADGAAVLSGAKPLGTLAWTQTANTNIYVADVPTNLPIDEIFVNEARQRMARFPNYDETKPLQGSASLAELKTRSASWANPVGGYFRARHNSYWGGNSFHITGKNPNSATGFNYTWVGDNNRGAGVADGLVENIKEELDQAKEWFYDKAAGKLYFWPENPATLTAATIDVAVNPEIFRMTGVIDGAQVHDVTLDGFTIQDTARTLFTGKYVPLMSSDWCVVRQAAVFLENAENCKVINSTFNNIGGNAIEVSMHNAGHLFDNLEMTNLGANGILFAGHPDACREPSFYDVNINNGMPMPECNPYYVHKATIEDSTPGPKQEHYPKNCTVSNTHMFNLGEYEKQSSGVAMSVSENIKVLHNTIHHGPRAGINVNDGSFGGHEIAYNDVFDVQRETDDHGMFNSWGRDRFWSLGGFNPNGTDGERKEPVSLLDAWKPTLIHDNRWHFSNRLDGDGAYGGSTFGIDLDDGSTNYKIYNNLCLNMGIKLREGFHREVYNNILVNGTFNLHVPFANAQDKIHSNIVMKGRPLTLIPDDANRYAPTGDVIDKNWYWDLGMQVTMPDWWGKTRGYDVNASYSNPQFKDVKTNDYTVMNTAAADAVGFKNFSMTQFGKPNCAYQSPVYEKTEPDSNVDMLQREVWLGANISGLDDAMMSTAGSGSLNGVYFTTVPQDSAAAKYGFETGDVIHTVNGVKLGFKDTFHPNYDGIPNGAAIHMDIIRRQLPMELNYIKNEPIESVTMIDDSSASVTYGTPSDNATTPWVHGTAGHGCAPEGSYSNTLSYYDGADTNVSFQTQFTGQQIQYIVRGGTDHASVNLTITDSTNTVVDSGVANCKGSGNQLVAFTSKLLPQGTYTIKAQKKTPGDGKYFIFDAFKVKSFRQEAGTANLTTPPLTITEAGGAAATVLKNNDNLHVSMELRNIGAAPLNAEIIWTLRGGAGVNQQLDKQSRDVTVAANTNKTETFTYQLPADTTGKRFTIMVMDKATGRALMAPRVLDGGSVTVVPPTMGNPVGAGIEMYYDAQTKTVNVAAKGLNASRLVTVTAKDSAANTNFLTQMSRATAAGIAKNAFVIDSAFNGNIAVTMTDETGKKLENTFAVNGAESVVDKQALRAEIALSKPIAEAANNKTTYQHTTLVPFMAAYDVAAALEVSLQASQVEVDAAASALTAARTGLALLVSSKTVVVSKATMNLYSATGAVDAGDRDGANGDWQLRAYGADATKNGAYAEISGNFTHMELWGKNKADSANFKVNVTFTDGTPAIEQAVTQTKNQGTAPVQLFTIDLPGKECTVRFTHNDENGADWQTYKYLEMHDLRYTTTDAQISALSEKTEVVSKSTMNLFSANGTVDAGDRDHANGDWQLRPYGADATKNGAYAERTGKFAHIELWGKNKANSANFKVNISFADGTPAIERFVTQTKDQTTAAVKLFAIDLPGKECTVRFTHNDATGAGESDYKYLEMHDLKYSWLGASVDPDTKTEITGAQAIAVTAPVAAAMPQNAITAGTGYTGAVAWKQGTAQHTGAFASSTVYSAEITLTAKTGFKFAAGAEINVAGATMSAQELGVGGATLTALATFPQTEAAGPQYTYQQLTDAIAAAQTLKNSVATSTNGTDVAASQKWATAANIAVFSTAIENARKITSGATASEISAAYAALAAAKTTFEGQCANGTKALITVTNANPTLGDVSMKTPDGTVIADASTIKVNDLVKLYAAPKANQRFVKWVKQSGGNPSMDTFAFEGTQAEYTANPLVLRAADAIVLQAEFAAIETIPAANPVLEMLTATASSTLRDAQKSVILMGADGSEGFRASAANLKNYDAYLLSGETSLSLSATFNAANTVTINGASATSANGGVGTPTVVAVNADKQQIPIVVTNGGVTTTYVITAHTTTVNPKIKLELQQAATPAQVEGKMLISGADFSTAQFEVKIDSAAATKFTGFTSAAGTALTDLTAADGFVLNPELAGLLQITKVVYDAATQTLSVGVDVKNGETLAAIEGAPLTIGSFYLSKDAAVSVQNACNSLTVTPTANKKNTLFDKKYRGLRDDAANAETSLVTIAAQRNVELYTYADGAPGVNRTRITMNVFTHNGTTSTTPYNVAPIAADAEGRIACEVPAGTYVIQLSAGGYLLYTSAPVTVDAVKATKFVTGGTLVAGELTGDAAINTADRTALLTVFNQAATGGKTAGNIFADFNDDGKVNAIDLGRLLLNYTK